MESIRYSMNYENCSLRCQYLSPKPLEDEPLKKKILIFAQDTGGTKAILPVINNLIKNWDIDLLIIGHLYACEIFIKEKINFTKLEDVVDQIPITEENGSSLLNETKPNIVFCTTSNNRFDPSNGNIISASRNNNIPSFALFDHWKGWKRIHKGKNLKYYLPNILGVIDEKSRLFGESIGIPKDCMEIVGQPHLEQLFFHNAEKSYHFRKKLNIREDAILCTFFSQPVIQENEESIEFKSLLDVKTKLILKIFEICKKELQTNQQPVVFCFKSHPKEPDFSLPQKEKIQMRIIDNTVDSLSLAIHSDLVLGIDSMILYEAYFSHCNTISLRFHELTGIDENFQLSPRLLPEAMDENDLFGEINTMKESILNHTSKQDLLNYPLSKGSLDKCEGILKRMIREVI